MGCRGVHGPSHRCLPHPNHRFLRRHSHQCPRRNPRRRFLRRRTRRRDGETPLALGCDRQIS
jgi:hypothetical protein